ncbi:DinB family protein [Cohnella hashimotonis]|uniref:DinB family protein n=1 Tax=Cohnella hashimotonis TaxID=2826895 RepID=A0ABT6TGK1_9BACL|nr:DinB family protein [Cohnella hashimotonis]MDI4645966.1 DinB family protein [Cohnella hashimotonis]
MFNSIENFVEEWEREAKMTAGLLDTLTDESLARRIVEDRRTLGDLAWHLIASIQFMNALGLSFEGAGEGDGTNRAAFALAQGYRSISDRFIDAIQMQWSDANLSDRVEIAGEAWSNGDSLRFALMHQAHHRGQMTVLMRQAGLRPPGLYGPAYETWVEQGMAPRA